MKKPPKAHLIDYKHDGEIPDDDINRLLGYRGTICGYQRKYVVSDPSKVNCKLCIREMEKRNI